MPTKQEKAVNRAFLRGKRQGKVREEKHVLTFLTAIILILLYLLFAQHNGWWPYSRPKLGSAFYTNVSAGTTSPSTTASGITTGGAGATTTPVGSTSGSAGSTSTGSGSGTTAPTSPSSSTTPIAGFAATVNVGNSEAQISSQANGLGQNCALVASASASDLGQQEVCTYTQGDKIVTVTFLNGHVVSASKSGF